MLSLLSISVTDIAIHYISLHVLSDSYGYCMGYGAMGVELTYLHGLMTILIVLLVGVGNQIIVYASKSL